VSGRAKVDLAAERRAGEILRAVAGDLRRLLDDAGMSHASLARAANLSPDTVSRLLRAERGASLETLARLALALDADVSLRLVPGAGVAIHDRVQARMIEAFTRDLHPRWRPFLEVAVRTPARGAIDLVLADDAGPELIAVEFQSQLRRVEQTIRWSNEKAASLPSTDLYRMAAASSGTPPPVSRLLVIRSSTSTREVVRQLPMLFAAAYPTSSIEAVRALRDGTSWPGAAIAWMYVHGREARLIDGLPRGLRAASADPGRRL
jgi:transcriptional regulator with XRE-family HTH domain